MSRLITVRTANNGGCGECACHCHSNDDDIPPGHLASCRFADPMYVPPDFHDLAMADSEGAALEALLRVRGDQGGES